MDCVDHLGNSLRCAVCDAGGVRAAWVLSLRDGVKQRGLVRRDEGGVLCQGLGEG